MRCDECRFWERIEVVTERGKCRARPPSPEWSTPFATDWCGLFTRKPEQRNDKVEKVLDLLADEPEWLCRDIVEDERYEHRLAELGITTSRALGYVMRTAVDREHRGYTISWHRTGRSGVMKWSVTRR